MTKSDWSDSVGQKLKKKQYREPKLAHLGSFTKLTMGGGGNKQDGGKGSPNTKL